MKFIGKLIYISLAMGGILLDKFNIYRIFLFLSLTVIYLFNLWFYNTSTETAAVLYFLLTFVNRYLFLFLSFRENGISSFLKSRYGEDKGFEIYKTATALMFFQGASAFSLLVKKTDGFGIFHLTGFEAFFTGLGFAAIAVGLIINIWCVFIVGVDVYYYKDMFLGRPVTGFKKEGPYRFLSNPMYGLGQSNGYGTALIHGSVLGIAGIAMNQIMMFLFYHFVEKPHIRRLFESKTDK